MSMLILVVETDLGSSLLFFGLFVIMLYVATERTSWIVFGLLLAGGGAIARRHDLARTSRSASTTGSTRSPASPAAACDRGRAGALVASAPAACSAPASARATPG